MRVLYLLAFCLLAACATAPVTQQGAGKSRHVTAHKQSNTKGKYSSVSRYKQANDGAPAGPIPTTFKEVKPKSEPLSRYGNPDVYLVEGRRYQVLKSSSGYKARGVASWYGTKFHKQRTSSGDDYNMYAMTAAHKTLPLPSYVRVKNLSNGQVAIVKVNDRGPFRNDRVIDLSYAAAAKLGLLPKGTAPVEIEALNMGKRVAHYYVQAGAFSSQNLALALKSKLAKLTPSPVIIEKYKQRYIVRVGPFASKQMSDSLKNKLAANGVSGSFALLL
ncbi:septal ring lytic transglycosylase RlpA family protein [Legionella jordanis]|uniref:Endolytic peptidoglycan transglycosylase RlpA n=1 Tax=Legionella jordanis TaxID=456 RepID=A0A0W0VBG8_9GAMM|nr:septal ring lytic transglycosylase RlpA family protein [Legionella jordanis]KTD17222.1 rare lipoprotein A [Legionella jordanis]RMX03340.1 septal ring lytic transglycosylase RlpA family protein [Legionella jordanis]RMX15819.1 septal ring lytic transglycosylase RlpA family protein [Legionella jordanis]VEH12580.1 Lipoprotein [Legionella jordanis]HAT8713346.1 septal ring lytic transglycosylase RlpA family protein [Legionella jordanis]